MDRRLSKGKFRLPSRYYDSVCRVCLSDAKVLVPLKDVYLTHSFAAKSKTETTSLIDVLFTYCNVLITCSDGKPQQICESCINMSSQAFSFFQSFLSSDNFLNEKLPKAKTSPEPSPVVNVPFPTTNEELANTLIKIESQNDNVISESIRFEIMESNDSEDADADAENIEDSKQCKVEALEGEAGNNIEIVREEKKPKISFFDLMNQLDPKALKKCPLNTTSDREGTFTCKQCEFKCIEIKDMIQHANENHLDPDHSFSKCVLCNKQIRDLQYNYHLATHCKKALVCKYCFMYFETKEAYEEHDNLIDHKNSICKVCNKKFVATKGKRGNIATKIRLHIRYAHEQVGKAVCNICGKQFKYATNVNRHYRSVHGKVRYLCQSCPRTFTSNYQLKFHVDQCHPEEVGADLKAKYPKRYKVDSTGSTALECEYCNKQYKTTHVFYVHSQKHPSFTAYACQICESEFSTLAALLAHQEEHPQHKCTYCDEKFVMLCDLITHKVKHRARSAGEGAKPKKGSSFHRPQGPQVIKCQYCPKVVRSYFGLYGHSWIHPEFKDYRCLICQMVLDDMDSFRAHYRELHPDLECNICQKMFPSKSSYFCHRSSKHREHNEAKATRKCNICGLVFGNVGKRQMEEHMYTHTGERPYICEICGKGFKQEAHLSIHRFQHGELHMKPWKCKMCTKSFVFPSTLKCHIRTHTGEKPYKCLYCPKPFRDQTTRHKHIKKFHEDRIMDYEVYRKERLREEMKRIEGDIETSMYQCDKALWKQQRFQGSGRTLRKKEQAVEEMEKSPEEEKMDDYEDGAVGGLHDEFKVESDSEEAEYILYEVENDSDAISEEDEEDEAMEQDEVETVMSEDENVEFVAEEEED